MAASGLCRQGKQLLAKRAAFAISEAPGSAAKVQGFGQQGVIENDEGLKERPSPLGSCHDGSDASDASQRNTFLK